MLLVLLTTEVLNNNVDLVAISETWFTILVLKSKIIVLFVKTDAIGKVEACVSTLRTVSTLSHVLFQVLMIVLKLSGLE